MFEFLVLFVKYATAKIRITQETRVPQQFVHPTFGIRYPGFQYPGIRYPVSEFSASEHPVSAAAGQGGKSRLMWTITREQGFPLDEGRGGTLLYRLLLHGRRVYLV